MEEANYIGKKTNIERFLRWNKKIHRFIEYITSMDTLVFINVLTVMKVYIANELERSSTLDEDDKNQLPQLLTFLKSVLYAEIAQVPDLPSSTKKEIIFDALTKHAKNPCKTLVHLINMALDEPQDAPYFPK